jgi:hypothetical protein
VLRARPPVLFDLGQAAAAASSIGNGVAHANGNGVAHANGNGVAHANGNGVAHANGNGAAANGAAANGVTANGSGEPLVALNPRKRLAVQLIDRQELSHNTRLFRFGLPSKRHKVRRPAPAPRARACPRRSNTPPPNAAAIPSPAQPPPLRPPALSTPFGSLVCPPASTCSCTPPSMART